MDGTLGPRWVMPMSGVVVMVISSEMPGAKAAFKQGSLIRRAQVRAGKHPSIRSKTPGAPVWFHMPGGRNAKIALLMPVIIRILPLELEVECGEGETVMGAAQSAGCYWPTTCG